MKYQRKRDEYIKKQWNDTVAHVSAQINSGNKLLSSFSKLFPDEQSYGWMFIEPFKLRALIPSNGEQKYYSIQEHGIALVADFTNIPDDKWFKFDSEYTALSNTQIADAYQKHIKKNPIVLFFYGCDDGHVGMRFKSLEECDQFLNSLQVFEDVFELDVDYKILMQSILNANTVEEKNKELDMILHYHN